MNPTVLTEFVPNPRSGIGHISITLRPIWVHLSPVDSVARPSYGSRMPAFIAMPRSLQIATALGYCETVAILGYGIAIAAFERGGTTAGMTGSDVAPAILVGIYVVFAAIVFAVTTGLSQLRHRAFTPYLVVQAFGMVVAQALLASSGTRPLGVLVLGVALAAAAAALVPATRAGLR